MPSISNSEMPTLGPLIVYVILSPKKGIMTIWKFDS